MKKKDINRNFTTDKKNSVYYQKNDPIKNPKLRLTLHKI
jgi:hypothetical protein